MVAKQIVMAVMGCWIVWSCWPYNSVEEVQCVDISRAAELGPHFSQVDTQRGIGGEPLLSGQNAIALGELFLAEVARDLWFVEKAEPRAVLPKPKPCDGCYGRVGKTEGGGVTFPTLPTITDGQCLGDWPDCQITSCTVTGSFAIKNSSMVTVYYRYQGNWLPLSPGTTVLLSAGSCTGCDQREVIEVWSGPGSGTLLATASWQCTACTRL